MKLRTQIILFLSLFGFLPLLAAVIMNLPPVMGQIQSLYSESHLQNLRADFSDLDQHLASRRETIRLLAKLPEPGTLLGETPPPGTESIDAARTRYTQWMNWVLADQHDIVDVIFLGPEGTERFWLQRPRLGEALGPTAQPPENTTEGLLRDGRALPPGQVAISPLRLITHAADSDPYRFLTLQMISPIVATRADDGGGSEVQSVGFVVISLDVGGLADAHPGTWWVLDDGRYLQRPGMDQPGTSAFTSFPGLDAVFARGRLGIWDGENSAPVLWVPLFATERYGPLWVGREVDPSPINAFVTSLRNRILMIIVVVLAITFFAARWVAVRSERIGKQLRNGIGKALDDDAAATFRWGGPQEVRVLAEDLTRLTAKHARRSEDLRNYAAELEATNQYKSEFLANVSHELRTPLNSILLLSRLLSDNDDRNLSPEQIRQLQVVNSAGQDLLVLIDQILDLSRIEAQANTIDLQKTSLREMLDELIDMVSPLCADKALILELVVQDGIPDEIITDRGKVRQIIRNFLSNAVKFTESGSITVCLCRNTRSDAELRPVCVSVKDTGIGIAPEKHDLIFEAFKQADGSTHRRYGGTGLGLSISRELAGLLGARLELRSDIGDGATFTICLPLEFSGDHIPEDQVNRELLTSHPGTAGRDDAVEQPRPFAGKRILVVDDDLRNLLALTPMLERWGFDVTAAGDGAEAMETLDSEPAFDAILMDIMMPGMDGVETTGQIRARPLLADIPVIALTAKADDEERKRCREAGMRGFVAKPVEPDLLHATLQNLLIET